MPSAATIMQPTVLGPQDWATRAEAHRARIAAFTDPIVELHHRGEKHPVHDFLFSYYSLTPGALQRWHPGAGVVLARSAGEGTLPDQQVPDDVTPVGATAAERAGVTWVIELHEPLQGVAPGQTAVLYQGTRVLGQATIDSAVNSVRLADAVPG